MAANPDQDLDLAEILQYYFGEIGVDMEINVMEPTVWNSYTRGGKAEMTYRYGWYGSVPPAAGAKAFTSGHSTFPMHHVDNPGYNEIYYKMVSTCDEDELRGFIN
jgi:ABC-type transport system substrate-binding protein